MTTRVSSQLWTVWLVLVGATCVSWWLGADHGFHGSSGPKIGATIILSIAFVKVRLVGMWFMELRASPPALRLAFECWVLVVAGLLIALYLAG